VHDDHPSPDVPAFEMQQSEGALVRKLILLKKSGHIHKTAGARSSYGVSHSLMRKKTSPSFRLTPYVFALGFLPFFEPPAVFFVA
jgi:hypothetical protein